MLSCGSQIMTTKEIYVLISGTCECCFIWEEGPCLQDLVKDLKMERLSWFIWVGPKCNHKCPYGREGKGEMTTEEYGEVTARQDATPLTSKMEKRTTSQGVQL